MLKDYYSIIEPFYECEVCNEPITNPICPSCLTTEIDIWSTNYPSLRRELIPKLRGYLKKLKRRARETIQCIKCDQAELSVCPFCFARMVLDELEEIQANQIVKKEFLQFFNYGLEPEEYH